MQKTFLRRHRHHHAAIDQQDRLAQLQVPVAQRQPLALERGDGKVRSPQEVEYDLGIAGIGVGIAHDADVPPLRRLKESVLRAAIPIDIISQRQSIEALGAGDGVVLAADHDLWLEPLIGELRIGGRLAAGHHAHRRQARVRR